MTPVDVIPVVAVGLCGSDIHRSREGFAVTSLGHELVGRRPTDEALVAIRPLRPCRTCDICRRGWTEQCASGSSIGRQDNGQGGYSGRVSVDADQLYPLPAQVPGSLATLADPLACILHALRNIDVQDSDMLVIGDGPMAALAAVYARKIGARRLTLAVKDPTRSERMSGFGDCVTTAMELQADNYDVVVEAVGGPQPQTILTAVTAVAPLGQVIALGVHPPHATANVSLRALLEKESTIRGSKAYRVSDECDDFASALDLLAREPCNFAGIITSILPWSPDDPPPILERRQALKTVHMREPCATEDARP